MYQTEHIEAFMKKVKEEAEKAAQAVYNKHNKKFREMVINQMRKGDELIIGMGSATFRADETEAMDRFAHLIAQIQYNPDQFYCGFQVKDFKK